MITPGNITATSGQAVTVTPSNTTTYTLTVTNSAGVPAYKTATVTVNPVVPAAPTITSFTASPALITAGALANLTGVFTGGTGIITPGEITATTGQQVSVAPTDTTTYTLTVTNSTGVTAYKTATITVNPPSPPAAPTNLSAAAGNATVGLSWTGSAGATTYNVYRGATSGGESATPIATGVTTVSYTDTGLTNSTTYYYKVAAVNSIGASPMSNEASATPSAAACSALVATDTGVAEIDLSWDLCPGATSYYILRSTTSGGPIPH
jgi:predicted phage tail protein